MIITYDEALAQGARFVGWENFAGDRVARDIATVEVYELEGEILCYTRDDAHEQLETLEVIA